MPEKPQIDLTQVEKYFNMAMSNLADRIQDVTARHNEKLDTLTRLVEDQSRALNDLKLNTSTQIVGINKDVTNLYEEIDAVKKAINSVSTRLENEADIRASVDKLYSDKVQAIKDSDVERWKGQDKLNDRFGLVVKLMYAVAFLVVAQIILLLWNVLLAGGLQNYINQFRGGP